MKNFFTRPISESRIKARVPNLAHYFILTLKNLFNFKQPLHAYQAKRGRLKVLRFTSLAYFQHINITSINKPKICRYRATTL